MSGRISGLTCLYCTFWQALPVKWGIPVRDRKTIKRLIEDHARFCVKHPMYKMKKKILLFEQQLSDIRQILYSSDEIPFT